MVNSIVSSCLFRVVLPLVLLAAVIFRFNALSFIYLLLLLIAPVVPGPSPTSIISGHTGRYIKAVISLSCISCLAHVVFQAVLLSLGDYGKFPVQCTWEGRLFALFGLHRLDKIHPVDAMRLMGLDFLVLLSTVGVLVTCQKAFDTTPIPCEGDSESDQSREFPVRKRKKRTSEFLVFIGEVLFLVFLAGAGVLHPSLISSVYFLLFLFIATWLASGCKLGRIYILGRIALAVYTALYFIVLYLYQLDYAQELIQVDSLEARLLGLVGLVDSTCSINHDSRSIVYRPEDWTAYVQPLIVLALYWLVCFLTRYRLSEPVVQEFDRDSRHPVARSESSRSSQRSSASFLRRRRRNVQEGNQSLLDDDKNRKSYHSTDLKEGLAIDPNGSIILSTDGEAGDEGTEVTSVGIMKYRKYMFPLISFIGLVKKGSYVATLIIMMTWSITYHSWLTFVLLLWSCILWMMPNSRQACLRSSPFLVLYAEALLLMQYIYGLDLNDSELPDKIETVNLAQIGLVKYYNLSYQPLLVKILYTVMLWVTLRQYVEEKRQKADRDIAEGVMMEPFNISYSTSQPGVPRPDFRRQMSVATSPTTRGSPFISRLGDIIKHLLTKYWIWIVACMLMVISLGGDEVVMYRIAYMFLFLFFILMFQFSYGLWRRVMYGFWLTVIVYSMLVLILIYTYQFENFENYWADYLGVPLQFQKDVGLEKYVENPATLFLKLLTPTFFLIITIIQLHYFHKEFLEISDIYYRDQNPVSVVNQTETTELPEADVTQVTIMGAIEKETEDNNTISVDTSSVDSQTTTKKGDEVDGGDKCTSANEEKESEDIKTLKKWLHLVVDKGMVVGLHISELIWRFLEIHLIKIVLFSALCLAVYDVCAVHLVFVMFVIVALPFKALQTFLSHCCSVWAAILLLSKMIYQLKFVDQYGWKVNCSDVIGIGQNASEFPYPFNETVDNRVWIGFRKTENLTAYCKGYIGLIVVLTIQAVVKIRQKVHRYHRNDTEPPGGVIFQDINRSHADRGLVECVKFLFNYFFYKFGVEFCFVTTVACIGVRLDVYAVVSAAWLCSLFLLRRRNMARVWPFYVSYQCIILPIQYIMCIGIPPGSCIEYPWSISSNFSEELREWLYLPNFIVPPNSYKILVDFFQLLFACCQLHVFTIETGLYSEMHEGGSNREIWLEQDPSSLPNPVPDFVTYTKSYLDMVKVLVFFSFYWITLAVVFLSGTSRVSLFAMGYVIGCFLFLWNGNEFYLKPMKTLLRMWNGLLAYNVVVILLKAILQVVGCVFLAKLYKNFCWVVQLLGVACIKKLAYHPTSDINKQIPEEDCTVPIDEAGLLWDGICFGFLLLQKRIFYSFYFQHLVREIRAQQMLASRGAELINEIQMKEVQEQQVAEKEIMEKIKTKMDRIRAHQQQTRGKYKEPESHFRAIRSGDYHMFEEFHDEDLDLDLSPKKTEFDEDSEVREKGLNALLSQTLKSNLKYAVEEVKKGSVEDDDIGESSEQSAIISADRSPASRTVSDSSQPQQPSRRVSLSPYDVPGAARRRSSAAVAAPLLSDETGRSYTSTISPAQNGVDTACDDAEETTQESFLQKVKGWMDFGVAFFLSVLISATAKLNTISKDYRFVARQLFREKQILKEQFDSTQPIENLERSDSIKMSYVKDPDVSGPSKETTTISIRLQKGSQDLAESIELVDTPDALEEDFEKSQPTVIRFLVALYYALVSRSELVCYLLIVVNQIKSASLLSLPLPFMAFLWGTLSVPRPSKTFWITIITYTEAIVVVKYLFQFDFFPWNGETHVNAPFWPPRILGIEQKNNYAVYDLALLLIVFFHRFILKSLGLWKDTEKATTLSKDTLDDKTVTSSKETLLEKTESRRGSTDETQKMTDRESSQEKPDRAVETQDEEDDTAVEESLKEEDDVDKLDEQEPVQGISFGDILFRYTEPFKTFFMNLLSPEYRVTVDVYAFMFFCDFINFLIVVFGYWAFGTGGTDGGVASYFEENKVPIPFLIMLIAQFALIVIDRALYLRKYILGKLFFQIVLVFIVHIWMFFILPAVTEREFTSPNTLPPKLWYFIKCVYLLLSAYQIRSGYPTRILGNFFCKKYNYVNFFLFKGYMLIPFLYELRSLMDWIWTDTSMNIGNWLKMEDIFTNIYLLKCIRRVEAEYPTPRGAKRTSLVKYGVGGFLLFIIILIIWFPLLLFALGNTVGLPNAPYDCTVEITIGGYEPIFKMSAQRNSLKSFTQNDWDKMVYYYRSDPSAQTFLANYDIRDVTVVELNGNSTSVWAVSPPSQAALITELLSNETELNVKLSWSFSRDPKSSDVEKTVNNEHVIKLNNFEDRDLREKLAHMLNGSRSTDEITLPYLFPKYLKVPGRGRPSPVATLVKSNERHLDEEQQLYRDLFLHLRYGSFRNLSAESEWWEIQEDCSGNTYPYPFLSSRDCQYLRLIAFSDKVFPSELSVLSGYGIVGLYTTFVLVVSRLVRGFVAGTSFTIMFDDMPYVDRVLQLCLDIYLVRESGEFTLEEDLFAKLIFLYRSPETLITWTQYPPDDPGTN